MRAVRRRHRGRRATADHRWRQPRPASQRSGASPPVRSRPHPPPVPAAKTATASTAAATAPATALSTPSPSAACATTPEPRPTSTDAQNKDSPKTRSFDSGTPFAAVMDTRIRRRPPSRCRRNRRLRNCPGPVPAHRGRHRHRSESSQPRQATPLGKSDTIDAQAAA